jgi:two-component system response regulator HydG
MENKNPPEILVVDDDPGHRTTLKTILKTWGYGISEADDGRTAVDRVRQSPFELILMDVRMAVMSGIDALKEINAYNPAIPIVIMTAYSSVQSAVEAMKAGAYDYLTKPLDFDELKLTIERALEHTRLKHENQDLKARLKNLADSRQIVSASTQMKSLLDMVATIAPSEATVLITGASGTGKELIARAVHANSSRSSGPMVSVNCAALTESLLESELFGHEKGSFTGADRRREGRFVRAHQGSLFLDEVGEMSMAMQAKLLRVLQEGEIQRVGGETPVAEDVRILAATNNDLGQMVTDGKFREDLFYRLNVVNLHIPPLAQRTDDIAALAQHFINHYAGRNRKQIKGFTPRAMDDLLKYPWPGNVRELENAMERAVILSPGEYITEKDLPLNISETTGQRIPGGLPASGPGNAAATAGSLDEMEKAAIANALEKAGGNKSEAARLLGITRRTLYNKLEKYRIE